MKSRKEVDIYIQKLGCCPCYTELLEFIYEDPYANLRKNIYEQSNDLMSKGYKIKRVYLGVKEIKIALDYVNCIGLNYIKTQFLVGDMLEGLQVIPVKFTNYCMVGV